MDKRTLRVLLMFMVLWIFFGSANHRGVRAWDGSFKVVAMLIDREMKH